jgi:hypothetical protein
MVIKAKPKTIALAVVANPHGAVEVGPDDSWSSESFVPSVKSFHAAIDITSSIVFRKVLRFEQQGDLLCEPVRSSR